MTIRVKSADHQRAQEWLSLQRAASMYCVSVDTLRRRVSAGVLPASRLGRRIIRVRVSDLESIFRPIPTVQWAQPVCDQSRAIDRQAMLDAARAQLPLQADRDITA